MDIFTSVTVEMIVRALWGLVCYIGAGAIILIVIFVIIYGLQFLSARGNPAGTTKAKSGLLWGSLGALLIIGSYIILVSIANLIGADLPVIPEACRIIL